MAPARPSPLVKERGDIISAAAFSDDADTLKNANGLWATRRISGTDMRMNKWMWWSVGILLVLVWLISGAYIVYRHSRITTLRRIALSALSDTATADAAVRDLNTYKGVAATDSLMDVALSEFPSIDNRGVVAIRSLAKRGDPSTLTRLTELLQPQVDFDRREAVAAALQKGICNSGCVRAVLFYEERLSCGVMPLEAVLARSTSDSTLQRDVEIEDAALDKSLGETLSRNEAATLQALQVVYGLGSSMPSSFALHVAETLHLRGACPLIASSNDDLADASQKQKVEEAFRNLNCEAFESR